MSKICDYTKNFNKRLGLTIYKLRVLKGISRQNLANKIGVSFQQLYKYENGINNITTAKFFLIANSLNKNLSYFHQCFSKKDQKTPDFKHDNLTRLIMNSVGKIENIEQKQAIYNLIKSITD